MIIMNWENGSKYQGLASPNRRFRQEEDIVKNLYSPRYEQYTSF